MSNITPVEAAKMLSKEAHQVYLDNWETKTRFAEVDCKWNDDIQHRNHMAMEELSTIVQHLAYSLEEALERIDKLEAQIDQK